MDFDIRMKRLEEKGNHLQAEISDLKDEYLACSEFTTKFLETCSKYGISRVSISKKDEELEGCKYWPFGYQGSVFADGRHDGWPTIWRVVEELKIGGGCGNSGQYCVNDANLVNGIYEFKDGQWNKVE